MEAHVTLGQPLVGRVESFARSPVTRVHETVPLLVMLMMTMVARSGRGVGGVAGVAVLTAGLATAGDTTVVVRVAGDRRPGGRRYGRLTAGVEGLDLRSVSQVVRRQWVREGTAGQVVVLQVVTGFHVARW